MFSSIAEWIIGLLLILSSLGVILAKQPVHACLSFLLTLLSLAALFLQLNAQFIAAMQILVYAGAILVIFMFVIVLFQDAHQQIDRLAPTSNYFLLSVAGITFPLALAFLGIYFLDLTSPSQNLPEGYGTVESLGYALYIDFFFPFEAVILLFLTALVGALYVGKKTLFTEGSIEELQIK